MPQKKNSFNMKLMQKTKKTNKKPKQKYKR